MSLTTMCGALGINNVHQNSVWAVYGIVQMNQMVVHLAYSISHVALKAGNGPEMTPINGPAVGLLKTPLRELATRLRLYIATGLQWACNGPAMGLQWGRDQLAMGAEQFLQWSRNGLAMGLQWACNGILGGLKWD